MTTELLKVCISSTQNTDKGLAKYSFPQIFLIRDGFKQKSTTKLVGPAWPSFKQALEPQRL